MVRRIVHSGLVIFQLHPKSDEITNYNAVITTLGAQASYRRAMISWFLGILAIPWYGVTDSYCFSERSRAGTGTLSHSLRPFLEMA